MTRGESGTSRGRLRPAAVALAGIAAIALGGAFYPHRFDTTTMLHQQAAYAATIVDSRRPLVVSFSSGGRLVHRKVADPSQQYLAVYDSSGNLLRWEHGDVFYIRAASGFCFQRMTGQDYVGRLYLPALPMRAVRNVSVAQQGDDLRISWQSRTGAGRAWRSNALDASYSTGQLHWYRFSHGGGDLVYPSGAYAFSYPTRVTMAHPPGPTMVCPPTTERLPTR